MRLNRLSPKFLEDTLLMYAVLYNSTLFTRGKKCIKFLTNDMIGLFLHCVTIGPKIGIKGEFSILYIYIFIHKYLDTYSIYHV